MDPVAHSSHTLDVFTSSLLVTARFTHHPAQTRHKQFLNFVETTEVELVLFTEVSLVSQHLCQVNICHSSLSVNTHKLKKCQMSIKLLVKNLTGKKVTEHHWNL